MFGSNILYIPPSPCPTGQFLTTNTATGSTKCSTPTSSASGITCSGSNCAPPYWMQWDDSTHARGVAAPTYTSVGADQAGSASTVQGNLNTHTGLTTTAHGASATPGVSKLVVSDSGGLIDGWVSGMKLMSMGQYAGPGSNLNSYNGSWTTIVSATVVATTSNTTRVDAIFSGIGSAQGCQLRILVGSSQLGPIAWEDQGGLTASVPISGITTGSAQTYNFYMQIAGNTSPADTCYAKSNRSSMIVTVYKSAP